MKVIVTCGPSYEPIDEVRRLTNFSTGELGVLLAEELARAGHSVICLKGSGATFPGPGPACQTRPFHTNDDLLAILEELSATTEIGALFHAAALCDYRVARVEDDSGAALNTPKISSRSGALTLHLEPATKVIHELRRLFPRARLTGWKYELAGTRDEALVRVQRQFREAGTNACVLNGRAWGDGFALVEATGSLTEWSNKTALARALATGL